MTMTIIIYLLVALSVVIGTIVLLAASRRGDEDGARRLSGGERRCEKCGHANSADGEFCGRCGEPCESAESGG